jgi:hypothetical protein
VSIEGIDGPEDADPLGTDKGDDEFIGNDPQEVRQRRRERKRDRCRVREVPDTSITRDHQGASIQTRDEPRPPTEEELAEAAGVPVLRLRRFFRSGAESVSEAREFDAAELQRVEDNRAADEQRHARGSTVVWHKAQAAALPVEKGTPASGINPELRTAIYGPADYYADDLAEKLKEAERRGIQVEYLPIQDLDLDAEERKDREWRCDPSQAAEDDLRAECASRLEAGFFRPLPAEPPAPTGRSARLRNPDRFGLIDAGFIDGEGGGGQYSLEKLSGPRRGTGRKAIRRAERFTNEAGEENYLRIGGDEDAIRKFLTRDGRTIEDYKSSIPPGRRRAEASSELREELATKVRDLVFKRRATRKAIAAVLRCDPKTVRGLLEK